MKYRNLVAILSALAILSLILWGKTALENAREGILICIQSLIPTLLPFFLISSLLTHSIAGTRTRCLSALEKLCSIPAGSGIYLVIGFLGGYPAGAANVSEGYRNGQLSRSDAERMLPFCSNAGPSFLFGILGPMFPKWWMPWLLWFVHIASAVFTAILIPGKPGKCMENRHMSRSIRLFAFYCGSFYN